MATDRVVMSRLTKGTAPDRDFDLESWQKLGPSKIVEAAWDMVVTAMAVRGIDESQLRLQRSVTRLERGPRQVLGSRRIRGHGSQGTPIHEAP